MRCFFIVTEIFVFSCCFFFPVITGKIIGIVTRLSSWDRMLDEFPQRVPISLRAIDREELSRGGRAYYDLLKVISDDKPT